jgi:abequosyltransferase
MTTLSICIPTFNFGAFIGQTLDSILAQAREGVEVIVLDGGSTDDTGVVVRKMLESNPGLSYHPQGFRGGIDRDIETTVGLARGRYCWLFSADDIMLPGAVNKVLGAIQSGNDIYVCEHGLCDIAMKPITDHPTFDGINRGRLFDLAAPPDKAAYFAHARTSEAFFSFMAAPIFKRELWNRVTVPESFRGTCWIVAGRLLSTFSNGPRIEYMGEKLLEKRGDNDSFADKGIVNRCRIAVEAFQQVAHHIFGATSTEAFHIRRVLKRDISLSTVLMAKLQIANNPSVESAEVLDRVVKCLYADRSPGNWLRYAIYRLAHPALLGVAYRLKKMARGRGK